MTVVLGAVCVALVVALVAVVHGLTEAHSASQAQWAKERHELLERIQRPERVPTDGTEELFTVPEHPPDQWAKVGQIDISDDYGLTDEDG